MSEESGKQPKRVKQKMHSSTSIFGLTTFASVLATVAFSVPNSTCAAPWQSSNRFGVAVQRGDLPIILSAPHGGRERIVGVPVRQRQNVRQFKISSDLNTDKLTQLFADAIERKLGKRPFVVSAQFHRKYIDANRPPSRAYETDAAKGPYGAYHTR